MKVIAMGDGHYVCTVDHTELEKYMNLYFGKMPNLKIGDVVDLGKGYSFHHDTKDALRKTEEFIKSNKQIIDAITSGISLFGGDNQ